MKSRFAALALVLLGICFSYQSSANSTTTTYLTDTTLQKQKGSWVALPVLYYSPETRLGFGVLGMHLFKPRGADTLTRTSNIQAYVLYTINKQLLISPRYTIFFPQDKYTLQGNLAYFSFPQFYYCIGNKLPEENEELVDYTLFRLENKFMKKLTPAIFAGPQWNYYQVYDVVPVAEGLLETTKPNGWNGYRASGLGLVAAYDTRDVVVNPSGGAFLEVSTTFNTSFFGSEYRFSRYNLDARRYFTLNKKGHVLALQGIAQLTSGDVPFLEHPALGGDRIMRGYYEGRYRDKQHLAAQAEYRAPLFWRIGAVAFAGLGEVAPSLDRFELDEVKPSYGLGLRFLVNKAERVNIRLDYGWGKDTSGFYLEITEAF
ncbi:outer membrane protein [Flammeovirgaceae bacterium 311]|nr:outer membrane protein [Flammeovirgaceae bacterium 311]